MSNTEMNGWVETSTCIFCDSELQPFRSVTTAPALSFWVV